MVMANDEKKKILRSYRLIAIQIKAEHEELYELMELINDPFPDGLSPCGEKMRRDIIDKREMMRLQIENRIKEKEERLDRITDAVNAVSNESERRLLLLRYIDGFTLEEIADQMRFSYRHILRIHNNALEHFEIDT